MDFEVKIPPKKWFRRMIIYGGGKTGELIYNCFLENNIECVAIFDKFVYRSINEKKITLFPTECSEELLNTPVILAIHAGVLEAISDLKQLGFKNIITLSQFYIHLEYTLNVVPPRILLLGYVKELEKNKEHITRIYDELGDDKSRDIFLNLLRYKTTGDYKFLIPASKDIMYYPQSSPFQFKNPISYVDCGAYDGDTIRILESKVTFLEITAFEPDPKLFDRLIEFTSEKKDVSIRTLQAGVGRKNDVVSFSSAQDGAASFNSGGEMLVPTVSLDTYFVTGDVDFIKMDIEGAEKEALIGATKLIRRCTPVLAIAIYHKHNDFWEIPHIIKELYPKYHIFIREPALESYHDTIFYAVPDKYLKV